MTRSMFPKAQVRSRPPLAPLIILLAALLLAGLLALISWRNFRHEEALRQRFLRQQGEILIRSFEAGARTGMMMRWRTDALKTLVDETVRETEVAYIAIVDRQGSIIAAGGSWAEGMSLPLAAVLSASGELTRLSSDATGKPVFEVARRYRPLWAGRRFGMGMHRRGMMDEDEHDNHVPPPEQAIFVGLYTGDFDQARRDSLHQTLLLGGMLLLVGSAGFYLLFLSQRNRVASSTLENMELYTASLIEGMPAGLLSLDPEGRVLAVNAQAIEMFATPRETLLGRRIADLDGGQSLCALMREDAQFIERACVWHLDDEELPLRVSASRLTNRSGEVLGTVLILRDMRELRAMEEQLERSRRHSALGVMATGVAHEIRNPLGTLRGFAQYFQRSFADAQAREYAGLMISEVDRLNRVISALLQFARPREAEPAPVSTAQLCERIEALMGSEAQTHRIDLQIDAAGAPAQFVGDFDLLLQMLLNLLQNAFEATPAGGRVDLRFGSGDAMLEIRVRDSGEGIDEATRQTIFDPFYTTRKSGTGLGLAIVSQIVEQHRGDISVDSQLGRGTEFLVRLPQQDIR